MSKDNPFGFVIPNLDDTTCSKDEYVEAARVMEQLATYLRAKGWARERRLRGEMRLATFWDGVADKRYAKLPNWAKW